MNLFKDSTNITSQSQRPYVTMFMLMSVDGRISTGASDFFDFDEDLPCLPYTEPGLHQYYSLEKETDKWALCSAKTQGKVLKKLKVDSIQRIPVNMITIGGYSLTPELIEKLSKRFERVILGSYRPLNRCKFPRNVSLAYCNGSAGSSGLLNFLSSLFKEHGIKSLTLQGGGQLNQMFLKHNLVDELNIVIAPLLVGGETVPTLISGPNPTSLSDLRGLKLISATTLKDSYIQLKYRVLS